MIDHDRNNRWYLKLMAPNTKGEKFAWLDPSAIYVNAEAFKAIVDDLIEPFDEEDVDLVAGPDAMGFVLGSAIASRLNAGFLTIRKAGKVPVPSDRAGFKNYTGRVQELEMRKPAFAPGTRVLLVDQWIETGGTMAGSIELITNQGGTVAGIATVCIEETHGAEKLRDKYTCATAVMPGTELQAQCNKKHMDAFDTFDWESIFPRIKNKS